MEQDWYAMIVELLLGKPRNIGDVDVLLAHPAWTIIGIGALQIQNIVIQKSGYCNSCGLVAMDGYSVPLCFSCDGGTKTTCEHGFQEPHTYYETCSTCDGEGTIESSPCTHGYSSSHRYCEHYTTTTSISHSYCSHGYTSQH